MPACKNIIYTCIIEQYKCTYGVHFKKKGFLAQYNKIRLSCVCWGRGWLTYEKLSGTILNAILRLFVYNHVKAKENLIKG